MTDTPFKGMNADKIADLIVGAGTLEKIDAYMEAVAKLKNDQLRKEVVSRVEDAVLMEVSTCQAVHGSIASYFDMKAAPGLDAIVDLNKSRLVNEYQKMAH